MTQIDRETNLSHHTEIIHNVKIQKKTIEAVQNLTPRTDKSSTIN